MGIGVRKGGEEGGKEKEGESGKKILYLVYDYDFMFLHSTFCRRIKKKKKNTNKGIKILIVFHETPFQGICERSKETEKSAMRMGIVSCSIPLPLSTCCLFLLISSKTQKTNLPSHPIPFRRKIFLFKKFHCKYLHAPQFFIYLHPTPKTQRK